MAVLGAERLVDLCVEALGDGAGALDEAGVELARGALELGLDELGVRARLLAIEHAGADLDGVLHESRGVLAGVLAPPRETDDRLVGDDEAVDVQPSVARVDMGKGQRSGSFHRHRCYGPGETDRIVRGAGTAPGPARGRLDRVRGRANATNAQHAAHRDDTRGDGHRRRRAAPPPRSPRPHGARAASLRPDARRRLHRLSDPLSRATGGHRRARHAHVPPDAQAHERARPRALGCRRVRGRSHRDHVPKPSLLRRGDRRHVEARGRRPVPEHRVRGAADRRCAQAREAGRAHLRRGVHRARARGRAAAQALHRLARDPGWHRRRSAARGPHRRWGRVGRSSARGARPRRHPDLGNDGRPKGRIAAPARFPRTGRGAVLEDPAARPRADDDRRTHVPLMGLCPFHARSGALLDARPAPSLRPRGHARRHRRRIAARRSPSCRSCSSASSSCPRRSSRATTSAHCASSRRAARRCPASSRCG